MGVESSISSKLLLRNVISILTIVSLEAWVASVSLKDGFWNDTKLSVNPSFQMECPDKPVLKLQPFGEYLVEHENQSLRLSSEVERTGNACFAPTIPPGESDTDVSSFVPLSDTDVSSFVPLSLLKFNQTPSYLAFLHDCSFSNVDHPYHYFTCPSVGANCSCVALVSHPEDLRPSPNLPACESHVFVPVELANWNIEEREIGEYEKKLTQGFKVIWNLTSWESCVQCKQSGGKCREREGCFLCKRGNTYRLIPCSSNNLNSPMCFR